MNKLTAAFLKHVGDYMLVETPLAKADVCLVFGGEKADYLSNRAADLYDQGYFNLIIVSGGVATSDGRLEAHRMRDVLLARGIPAEKIIVEDRAQNTCENVQFSKELLEKKMGSDKIKSVLAIGQIHASRRFLMTLEQRWPQVLKMFTAPNYFHVPREKWYADPVFREAVLREYQKIPKYKAQGFVREVDLAQLRQAIAQQPKPVIPPKPQ